MPFSVLFLNCLDINMADVLVVELENCVVTLESILTQLKNLKDVILAFQAKCNIAKTVGTSVGTVGSICVIGALVAAPFTGGASLVATIGCGSLLAGGGAVANMTTDICDHFNTKSYIEKIETLCEHRKQVHERIGEMMEEINELISLLRSQGMSQNEAIYAAIHQIKHADGKRMIGGDVGLVQLFLRGKAATDAVAYAWKIQNTALVSQTLSSFTLRNGDLFWNNFRFIGDGLHLTSKFGQVIATRAVAGTFAVITLGAAVWNIRNCVNSWRNDPPTVQSVTEVIDLVTNEIATMRELINDLHLNGE